MINLAGAVAPRLGKPLLREIMQRQSRMLCLATAGLCPALVAYGLGVGP